MSTSPASSSTLSAAERRTRHGGVFDTIVVQKVGFGPCGLASKDYNIHFKKVPHWGNNEKFVNARGGEFKAEFIGELVRGTVCHPMGNYAVPQKEADGVYVATLYNIIEDLSTPRVKMFVAQSDDSQLSDLINISTEPLYIKKLTPANDKVASPSKMTKVSYNKDNKDNDGSQGSSSDGSTGAFHVDLYWLFLVGDLFNPSLMPGYGGGWFNHSKNCKVQQLDIRDLRGDLIPPYDTWMWIKEGMLVFVKATLHVFNIDNHTVNLSAECKDNSSFGPVRPEIKELPVVNANETQSNHSDLLPFAEEVGEEVCDGPINFESMLDKGDARHIAKRGIDDMVEDEQLDPQTGV
ncbi:hypothetical protein K435DRAFT_850777 [Dendrothele bispora CBS 962.96]|uniref:Uncharacterized protein n=1 Tax=Dendrothele bispora (strain CBS 962.96) TaxID=1314807 RepID=A0A4S8MNQ8_DENBC|nr:hypothetical protein K435DRAFT_850777 [Dendrothele bispora CBS 962.96]